MRTMRGVGAEKHGGDEEAGAEAELGFEFHDDPYVHGIVGCEGRMSYWPSELKLTVDLRLRGFGTGSEAPAADGVLGGGGEQSVAGLDLSGRDLAVGLDGDEQDDLAADVHAASEFGVGGGDAGDDGSRGRCGEGGRSRRGQGRQRGEEGARNEVNCQGNLHLQRLYRRGGARL